MNTAADTSFAPVARRVARRITLRRWLGWLGRTLWPAALIIGLLSLSAFSGHTLTAISLSFAVLSVWLLLPLIYFLIEQPGLYSVLALWDQAAGRREAFASAWWFQQQSQLTAAQLTHIEAQRAILLEAEKSIARDLPLQPSHWLWLPPVLALASLFISAAVQPVSETLTLDAAMQQTARREAAKLARSDWDKKKLDGLNAYEAVALEKLKQSLKQTAADLENTAGKDARDIMSELESRAREAEKLAERLAADKDNWASDKLIQSLREHADTADLGDAVAAKNAAQTARSADALAQQLQSPQLSPEARERLNETLKDSQQNSEKEDRTLAVGQHVLGAADQMQKKQPAIAGAEFQKLADKMRDQARREQAQKELEKLAQQLRDSGSSITGLNQTGAMQQMAGASQQAQQGQAPQVGQAQPNAGKQPGQQGQQPLQPPGLGQMSPGQQQMMQQNPTPSGQPQQMMMAQGQPGQQGKDDQPMLFAPVPGQKPGDKPPEAILLGPAGQNQGGEPKIAFTMPGGLQAGAGRAELNAEATAQQKTGSQSVVTAQQNNDGTSSVRSIEGGVRKEGAARTASQIATESIAAEEAALDEAVLPPSRREQVRRYFTELRKRFEKP